jgi:hypothetical protein
MRSPAEEYAKVGIKTTKFDVTAPAKTIASERVAFLKTYGLTPQELIRILNIRADLREKYVDFAIKKMDKFQDIKNEVEKRSKIAGKVIRKYVKTGDIYAGLTKEADKKELYKNYKKEVLDFIKNSKGSKIEMTRTHVRFPVRYNYTGRKDKTKKAEKKPVAKKPAKNKAVKPAKGKAKPVIVKETEIDIWEVAPAAKKPTRKAMPKFQPEAIVPGQGQQPVGPGPRRALMENTVAQIGEPMPRPGEEPMPIPAPRPMVAQIGEPMPRPGEEPMPRPGEPRPMVVQGELPPMPRPGEEPMPRPGEPRRMLAQVEDEAGFEPRPGEETEPMPDQKRPMVIQGELPPMPRPGEEPMPIPAPRPMLVQGDVPPMPRPGEEPMPGQPRPMVSQDDDPSMKVAGDFPDPDPFRSEYAQEIDDKNAYESEEDEAKEPDTE